MKKLISSLQFLSMLFALPCSTYPMFYLNKLASYITAPKDPLKDPSINTDKICWLNKLPGDIQNEIAEYLTFNDRESDAEFIRRTSWLTRKFVTQGGCAEFKCIKKYRGCSNILSVYSNCTNKYTELYNRYMGEKQRYKTLFEFAPNNSKVILAEDLGSSAQAYVFDLVSQKEIYKKNLETYPLFPLQVAISSDGTTLATIVENNGHSLLTVENILNNNTEKIEMSEDKIEISGMSMQLLGFNKLGWLDFNKQGTKIRSRNVAYRSFIHSLVSEKEHNLKSKKTLIGYFRQKGICKQYAPKSINDLD